MDHIGINIERLHRLRYRRTPDDVPLVVERRGSSAVIFRTRRQWLNFDFVTVRIANETSITAFSDDHTGVVDPVDFKGARSDASMIDVVHSLVSKYDGGGELKAAHRTRKVGAIAAGRHPISIDRRRDTRIDVTDSFVLDAGIRQNPAVMTDERSTIELPGDVASCVHGACFALLGGWRYH